jgi:hypothetical protein
MYPGLWRADGSPDRALGQLPDQLRGVRAGRTAIQRQAIPIRIRIGGLSALPGAYHGRGPLLGLARLRDRPRHLHSGLQPPPDDLSGSPGAAVPSPGALLWLVPQVLAIERTSQAFFAPVVSVLTSTNHPDLATWILVGSVVLVALTGAYIFNFGVGRAPRQTPQPSEPRSAEAAPGR